MNVVLHLLLLIAPEYAIVPADAPVLPAMAARIFGFENPTRTSLARGSGECLWFGGQAQPLLQFARLPAKWRSRDVLYLHFLWPSMTSPLPFLSKYLRAEAGLAPVPCAGNQNNW